MNIFAKIILLGKIGKVYLYTVQLADDEAEYENWNRCHCDRADIREEYGDLVAWIKIRICQHDGAKQYLFRPEQEAFALPPSAKYLSVEYKEALRLYCYPVNENALILYNGGVKTAEKAQDCPTVGPHFRRANKYTKQIYEAIKEQRIRYGMENELLIDPDFEIEL